MLRERLERDQEAAMREKDPVRLRTIRSLRAAIQTQEIANRGAQGGALDDEAVLAILGKQAKQRRDSIEQFQKGGRSDLVSQELAELSVIESYLPTQLSDEEIESAVREIIIDVGATDSASMGKVMGAAMAKLRGVADGKRVQEIVRRVIGQ